MADPMHELEEMVRLLWGLERYSEENDPHLDRNMDKVREVMELFHQKYPQIKIEVRFKLDRLSIRIFIKGDSVKDIFKTHAAKIPGLGFIGLQGFQEVPVQDAQRFSAMIEQIDDEVYATYAGHKTSSTVVLRRAEHEHTIELVCAIDELRTRYAAPFQFLLRIMAIEHQDHVDVLSKAHDIGFSDMDDQAHFEFEDEFMPHMLE